MDFIIAYSVIAVLIILALAVLSLMFATTQSVLDSVNPTEPKESLSDAEFDALMDEVDTLLAKSQPEH